MEIKIDREVFFKTVSRVQSIIERRSNMPILSTVLLTAEGKNVLLSATDLELGFQQSMQADVIQEGSVTIGGRKLFEILKESKSMAIHIKKKESNWVFISDGLARFDLACLPADEYPTLVAPEGVSMVEMDGNILGQMIDKTIYAVTLEEAGFKLSGVFTEKVEQKEKTMLRMVATDGHRLSMMDKSIPNSDSLDLGKGVMIPKKGMAELKKLASEGGTILVGFGKNSCVAKRKEALLVMRLLEAKFPDYHSVIPKEERYVIEVKRMSLLEAIRKMLILSNERYRAVKITLENDVMELISTNPDLGEAQENMQVKYRGERLELGFNPRYFLDALQTMESEKVSLGFIDNSRPCILRGDADNGFLGLIMPMRL